MVLSKISIGHPNFNIDLKFKSKRTLIETINSGTGKTFVFNMVQQHIRGNLPEISMYAFDYMGRNMFKSSINGICECDSNFVLIDDLELLLDKESEDSINRAKCQVVMFGRNNKSIELGRLSIAELKVDGSNISLDYPQLEG